MSVHPVSYHVSECVGGSVLISLAGGFSFHASLPTGYPGATPLALLHAGVIGGGRVMLTLSCGLEIFIFASVIHLVQVAKYDFIQTTQLKNGQRT